MDIKAFKKTYDADLIPASYESLIVGKCVWDPLIGKPHLKHPGMYDNVFEGLYDADVIDEPTLDQLLTEARSLKFEESAFAHVSVHFEIETAVEMDYPNLAKLNAQFNLSRDMEFSFGDIRAKVINSSLRRKTASLLEDLKTKNWKKWDSDFRRLFVITKLYYGSTFVTINTDGDTELEGQITQAAADLKIPLSFKTKFAKKVTYSFDNDKVPFAMSLEKLKPFV